MVEIKPEGVLRETPDSPNVFTPFLKKADPSLKAYLEMGGYSALEKALSMSPDDVIKVVKDSGLRGRGGAGFPAGVKWGFIPKDAPEKYLVCNADEGEPATFKDRYLLSLAPHLVIEGMLIASYAIGAKTAICYIRGEYWREAEIFKKACAEAEEYVRGKFGLDVKLRVMSGAGAYIVGEETGLLSSLEGKRGHPRPKPPFPAQKGYMDKPTCINNVETLACVPLIVKNGADWFRRWGTEESTGPKLFCVSGCVKNPGLYELPLGYPLSKLLEFAGATACGAPVKAVIPGGTSTPPLTADEVREAQLSFEGIAKFGSFLGTGGVVVICERMCMVKVAVNMAWFYADESCGQCTTCREGTRFIEYLFEKIEEGRATEKDVQTLLDVAENIRGSAICAHVDALAMPTLALVRKFEKEIREHLSHGCPDKNHI